MRHGAYSAFLHTGDDHVGHRSACVESASHPGPDTRGHIGQSVPLAATRPSSNRLTMQRDEWLGATTQRRRDQDERG